MYVSASKIDYTIALDKLLVYSLSYLVSSLCSFPYRLGEGGLGFDTSRRRQAAKREPTHL